MLNPMKVFWCLYLTTLCLLSYAIRICERPLTREDYDIGAFKFSYLPTSLWMMMISIPSVGYGDKYPVTLHGRFLASISFICGTFLFSILCNSLVVILNISKLEQKAILLLTKLGVRYDIKVIATRMIQCAFKIGSRQRKGIPKSLFLDRELKSNANILKSTIR